ncbi:DgyrCDS14505 [Dimorphilus gyrociliatus]|uniref:DgyrCDS14505 n=1 Tax=Dimorphilus gyrociliatus TaxID=2664684 RepID=A0A7I8WE48_9ANNE|nr:DgyrCDS14505 [Dimorphilus gyrociliatus]
MQCANQQCIDEMKICDNERNCFDDSDEICHSDASPIPINKIACHNRGQGYCDGVCKPQWLWRDGRTDCIDQQDEPTSSSYISNRDKNCYLFYNSLGYAKTNLFLTFNCHNTTCKYGQYQCHREKYSISIEQVCDNIDHCPLGDDEIECG